MNVLDSTAPGARLSLVCKPDYRLRDVGLAKSLKVSPLASILDKNLKINEFRQEAGVCFQGRVDFASGRFEFWAHFQTSKSNTTSLSTPLWLGIDEDQDSGTDQQTEEAMHAAYCRCVEAFKPEAAVCSASSLTEHVFTRLKNMDPHPNPSIFHIVPGQQETGAIGYKMYFAKSVMRITVNQTAFDIRESESGYHLSLSDRLADAFTEECIHALAVMCLELDALEDWPRKPGHITLRDKARRMQD